MHYYQSYIFMEQENACTVAVYQQELLQQFLECKALALHFFRIKEKSCVDIAASYRKTGVFTFLQTKNTHFGGENKKYAFSWRIFQIKMDISVWKIVYHMTGKERGKNGAGMDKRDISQCVRNLQYNGLPALYAQIGRVHV